MKNRLYLYDESDNDSVNLSMTTQHNYKRFLIRQISKDNTKSALKGKNVINVNKISEILTKAVKVRLITRNPAYGRHQLSRPMRRVGPIQI